MRAASYSHDDGFAGERGGGALGREPFGEEEGGDVPQAGWHDRLPAMASLWYESRIMWRLQDVIWMRFHPAVLVWSQKSFIPTSVPPADADLKHGNVQVDLL